MYEEYTQNIISHKDDRRFSNRYEQQFSNKDDRGNCNTCIQYPDELCYFKSRKSFINRCLPFNNFDESKINILNFDKTHYIYYNENNKLTYYLDKKFILHKCQSKIPFENINLLSDGILSDKNKMIVAQQKEKEKKLKEKEEKKLKEKEERKLKEERIKNYEMINKIDTSIEESREETYEEEKQREKEEKKKEKAIIKKNENDNDILFSGFYIDKTPILGLNLFCNYTHVFNIFSSYFFAQIKAGKKGIVKKKHQLKLVEIDRNTINKEIQTFELKYANYENANKNLYKIINENNNIIKKNEKLKEQTRDNEIKNKIDEHNIQLKNDNKNYSSQIFKNRIYIKEEQSKLNNNNEYKYFKELLDKNLKQKLKIDTEIEITNKELNLLKTSITNILQFDSNNKFIKLSYKFNIFNISLLCEKYVDIMEIICKLEEIKLEHIIEIFKEFSLINLYYLIKYKKKIKQVYKDDQFMDFMNSKFKTNNIKDDNKNKDIYNDIINIENSMNNITETLNTKMYEELHLQLVFIQSIVSKIRQIIPNYHKLFLMAFIAYRNNNNLINNTWGFLNKKYIINLIINNSNTIEVRHDIRDQLIIYYKPELPILYDNDTVTYKNVNYGNCMENTIFQFLKVIFWNKEINNYDFNRIKEIINDEYNIFINNLFININNEKTFKFINDWLIFINELPKINNNKYGNYDFENKTLQIEINPSLNNLITALKYLIKWDYDNVDNNTFMSNLISRININYKINIKYENKIDKIELIFDQKKYIIQLNLENHASFEGITDNYILNTLPVKVIELIKEPHEVILYLKNSPYQLIYSNLNEYIIYIFLSNKTQKTSSLLSNIDKSIIIDIIDNYIRIFHDKYNFMLRLIYVYKYMLVKEQIETIYNNIIIHIRKQLFDTVIALIFQLYNNNKNILLELNSVQILQILYLNIVPIQERTIDEIITNKIYIKKFDNLLWFGVLLHEQIILKFIDILDDSIISNWDLSIWIPVFFYYNYTKYGSNIKHIEDLIKNYLIKTMFHKTVWSPVFEIIKLQVFKIIQLEVNSNTNIELLKLLVDANINIKLLIVLIITNIPESDWIIIFNHIKILNALNVLIYISDYIKYKKLYETWQSETLNEYFTTINIISKNKNLSYNDIDTFVQFSLYSNYLSQLNWGHLGYLLKLLRDKNIVNF